MRAYHSGRVGGATTQSPCSPSETVTPGTTSFVVQEVQVGDNGRFHQGPNYTTVYNSIPQENIWTSTSDVSKNLRKAVDKRTPHTGLWFLKSKKYISWRDDETRVLVVHGRSGCGKTILSSTVIQDLMRIIELQDRKLLSLAFYYFDSQEADGRDTRDFLLSTILHLTEDLEPQEQSQLRKPYQLQSRQDLIELFQKLIGKREKTYLVIDALDECRARGGVQREILSILRQLAQLPNLRILITTQDGTCFDALKNTLSLAPCSLYPLPVDQVNSDIKRFVNSKLEDHDWRHVSKELVDKIRETLSDSPDGMFRLTACKFDELYTLLEDEPALVISQLERALENIPRDLIQYYDSILQKIRPEQKRVAIAILRWLVCATRPLLLTELEELVQFHFSEDNEVLALIPRSYLIKTFSSLIEITANPSSSHFVWEHEMTPSHPNYATTPRSFIRKTGGPELAGDKVVRLAHGSVREYLCGSSETSEKSTELVDFQLDEREAHRMVGLDCLKYLKFCALVDPHRKSGCEQCPLKKSSILEYAVNRWSYHGFMNEEAYSSLTSDDPPKIMDENINFDKISFSKWADSSTLLINKLATGQFPPTCLGGQTSHKPNTASPAMTRSGVVLLAELTGHWQMIRLLLSHDAPADSNPFDGSIVIAAVQGRYSRILDLLLVKTRAKQFGLREDDWLLLLVMKMDSDELYNSALFGFVEKNEIDFRQEDEIRCKFVNLLLSWDYQGSDRKPIINGKVRFGENALHLAIRRGYRLVVASLLGGGADSDQEDDLGIRPIHLARELNELEIERMLLDIGADPSPPPHRRSRTIFDDYVEFENSNTNYIFNLPGGV